MSDDLITMDLIILCRQTRATQKLEFFIGSDDIIEQFHNPDCWSDIYDECIPTTMHDHLQSQLTMLALIYDEYEFPTCQITFKKREPNDDSNETVDDVIRFSTD